MGGQPHGSSNSRIASFSAFGVEAHYLIDRRQIFRFVADYWVALRRKRLNGGAQLDNMNRYAIGVELWVSALGNGGRHRLRGQCPDRVIATTLSSMRPCACLIT